MLTTNNRTKQIHKREQTGNHLEGIAEKERNSCGRLEVQTFSTKQMSHRFEMYSVGNTVNN